ncbi:MAG: YhjD/YihY/BrkB family envelope integrity protein [Desulfatirhabdiaceae bacterium]
MEKSAVRKIREFYFRVVNCFHTGTCFQNREDESPLLARFDKPFRVLLLAARGFKDDNCALHASALTFYSLLSIVPLLAMAFGIAKGFGFEKLLEKRLMEEFQGQQEVLTWMITFANAMLDNTQAGLVAGIGVIVLFWSVIKVLGHIEYSFNTIWHIRETRSYWRKFSDYLAIMMISPILVILSGSVTVFIKTRVTEISEQIALVGYFSPAIFFGLNLLPFCLIWMLFTFLYILMPNTRIKFSAGIVAGMIAGTLYQLAQWSYIGFQVGMAQNNAIYGSFAALPLFLAWLQISWLIVLGGSEIAFAQQNLADYEQAREYSRISPCLHRLLTLQAARVMVKNFALGASPLTRIDIARRLSLPIGLVNRLVTDLLDSGTFTEIIVPKNREPAFQPARDIQLYTLSYMIEALEKRGSHSLDCASVAGKEDRIYQSLVAFRDVIESSPANILLKDI